MLPLATLALIAWTLWRGGSPLGAALMAAGLLVHLALGLRLARTTLGGVGGHAEWLRDTSTRPRLRRSPGWLAGLALILAGLAVALLAA
jgi:hypothetical protein